MSVFISYNHKDSEFVDKLAIELVRHNVKVWKDKWKISVGDSFITKIQDGIEGASYMCIVLSKNSIQSDWVKKELNAALIREVDDKKITILPILIDDCKIPLFLREKLYADFREDFDTGLKKILAVITKKYNLDGGGRVSGDTTAYFDFAIENGFIGSKFFVNIDIVSFDTEEDFSILTQFKFLGAELDIEKIDSKSTQVMLLKTCAQEFEANPGRIKVTGDETVQGGFTIDDTERDAHYAVGYRVKRLGVNTGSSLIFNIGALFTQICDTLEIDYA